MAPTDLVKHNARGEGKQQGLPSEELEHLVDPEECHLFEAHYLETGFHVQLSREDRA